MQTIRPAKDQLFCKPDETENKTKSGLYIADKSIPKPKTAKVINVGRDVEQYQAEDTIVYKDYSTSDIKLNGEDFFLIAEEDVLGIVLEVGQE